MLRSILAGIAGMLVSVVLVTAVELVNSVLFPFPPGLDMYDREAIAAFIQTMPAGAFVAVWLGWALGAFAGTWTAKKLTPSGSNRPAITVAVVFALFCVANMAMIPHPLAFIVASVVTTPLASLAALKLGGHPPAQPATLA